MELKYQENWETIKKRLELLWENEILDRPVVSVKCLKDKNNPYTDFTPKDSNAWKDFYCNPECILERNLDMFQKSYFGGDAFPVIQLFWGVGGHSKYLESLELFHANTRFAPDTIWFHPVLEDYDSFSFEFDKKNPLFQAELESMKYLAEVGKGKFFIAMPDNCGSYDALGNLRDNQRLIMDFIDQPEAVKRAGNKMVDTLIESSNEMFQIVRENCDGGSVHSWMGTWSPGRHMQLQCDLSVMISANMYEEFIMEELERSTEWLDHSIYHLDGMEQARFLDMLTSVKKLNMIQWTQVMGQPDVTRNFHHIQKIQAANKGVVLIIEKHQLDAVLNHVSPKGRILLVLDASDQQEADEIVDYVAKHSFQKRLY